MTEKEILVNKRNGRGTLTYPDGKITKGKWKNGMFDK